MPISDLPWAISDLTERAPRLRRYQDYYEGHHKRVVPDSRTLSPLMKDLLDHLTDNLCDDVVDEPLSRLEVLNWSSTRGDGQAPDPQGQQAVDALGQAAADLWDRTRGPAWLRSVFRSSWRDGDGYVIVQRNVKGDPTPYVQRSEQMAVQYDADEPGTIRVAAKAWKSGRRWRINLYYSPVLDPERFDTIPDGVQAGQPWLERYTSRGSAAGGEMPQARSFEAVTEADGDGLAVEPLEGDRIPVFHYPADEWGQYGRSALSDVMGLNDVLNKSVADLVVAGEFTALPQRWATGIQAEIDPVTGQEKPLFRSGVERLIRTGSKDASFGQFASSDLGQFLSVQSTYRLEIARKGKLPLHSVSLDATGSAPSGLSLLVAEGAQVKRVRQAQDEGGMVLREQAAYMLTLAGMPCTAGDLAIEWQPPQTRDDQALLEVLSLKVALGLPKGQALIEAGYDPDRVAEWVADAAVQAEADAARQADMMAGRISAVPTGPLPVPPVGVPGAPAPAGG